MKITSIGHASILIEAQGLSILSDPWWTGPCFGAQWWTYPRPFLAPLEDRRLDFIYISHGHHDHLHPGTLRTLSREAKVLVAKGFDIAEPIRKMGFTVIEVPENEEAALGRGVGIRIMPTHSGDSLAVISGGDEVCANLNDALHSKPASVQDRFFRILRAHHPQGIDYVFCGYGVASHFPNCYVIPGKDREKTAAVRQAHFNRVWARIIDGLAPKFGFPFAADVVLLDDDLSWANEPVHNSERPTEAFLASYPRPATTVVDCAPGFAVEDGVVRTHEVKRPLSSEVLSRDFAVEVQKANAVPPVADEAVEDMAALLRQSVKLSEPHLLARKSGYEFLVRLKSARRGIAIRKAKERFEVSTLADPDPSRFDLTYTTRHPYLRNSLSTRFGAEVLFVGSGGIFQYPSPEQAWRNLHQDLGTIMGRRPRRRPTALGRLKDDAKSLLGLAGPDLYDLRTWTVMAP